MIVSLSCYLTIDLCLVNELYCLLEGLSYVNKHEMVSTMTIMSSGKCFSCNSLIMDPGRHVTKHFSKGWSAHSNLENRESGISCIMLKKAFTQLLDPIKFNVHT